MEKDTKEINPIILTDVESGEKFTLEFTADSVKYAQFKGFNIDDIEKTPMITIPLLFEYAFRANHKNVTKTKIDRLWNDLGGMPSGMLERLTELYYKPYNCLINTDEDKSKNAKVTVEF